MEISIIIPVYNKETYLEKCFDSIFSQDFDSFEVVAVDDGSTDGSGQVCDSVAAREQRLRVIHVENGGVTAARRIGTEQAVGRYITFVDADDLLTPHSLRTMHRAITQSGADEVIGTYVNQHGHHYDSGLRGVQPCEPLVRNLLAVKNSFCVLWGIIFKRELLKGCLGAPREIVEREDSLMQIKCLMKSPRVFFIPDTVYLHYDDMPNDRVEDLQMIRIYDEELRQTLQPQWNTYRADFVRHQLKVYEKFIDRRQFHVLNAYYRPLRRQLDSSIPFMDRMAILLPPRLSYYPIHLYKWLLRHKGSQ